MLLCGATGPGLSQKERERMTFCVCVCVFVFVPGQRLGFAFGEHNGIPKNWHNFSAKRATGENTSGLL